MIAQGALPTRFQSAVSVTLLLLFGAVAFSMPAPEILTVASEVWAVPVAEAPAAAESMPGANAVENVAGSASAAPVAARVASKQTTAKKSAVVIAVAANATTIVDSAHTGLVAASMKPALTVARADSAAPAMEPGNSAALPVAASAVVTTEAKPETYPGWEAIKALAKAATVAREPTIKAITEWNLQAMQCPLPAERIAAAGWWHSDCRQLYNTINDGKLSEFKDRCSTLGRSYQKLAAAFARAEASQFIDRQAVRGLLAGSYQTISEFCGTGVIQQKYPKLLALMRGPIGIQTQDNGYAAYWNNSYLFTNYAATSCMLNSASC